VTPDGIVVGRWFSGIGTSLALAGADERRTVMRRQRGFTLIELLIVVAIIGIIAAIAIPNLLNAINRGRQKRSMADMRSIATAIEAYAVDNSFYPKSATEANIEDHISPTYLKNMPDNDGWRHGWDVVVDTAGQNYTIASAGRNAAFENLGEGVTTDFDEDIVYSNGVFVRYPEGIQTD
jgi:type II secretion system protein G